MPARRLLSPARVLFMLGVTVLFIGVVGASSASADIPWAACPAAAAGSDAPTTGYQCARVDVPLDRSGATPGTVGLAVSRVAAASNPGKVAVVPLAGGPGQAALPLAQSFARFLTPALSMRDLLIYDQRGTGSSGRLNCQSLTSRSTVVKISGACASELGPGRAFYRTSDSVQDIEALRVAGGYDKLVLFGVSYGTKVAEDYAAAYPNNVEAMVLDSVVLPEGPDPFQRSTLSNAPRVLRDLCAKSACKGATDNVSRDLTNLAAKLRKGSLKGKTVLSSGSRVSLSMAQDDLLAILLAGDLNPTLRAELPGSMRAALRGDASPLLRLAVRSEGLTTGLQGSAVGHQSSDADSNALFLATTCEESPFAWTRTAGVDQRYDEVVAAANAIPKAQLGPFSPSAAISGGPIPLCIGWPDASPAPAAAAPLPPVRTLVLSGQMDLRTPFEDAQQLASRIPGTTVVQVPYTGHSTISSDVTADASCTKTAVAAFFSDGVPGACTPGDNPYAPTRRPPTSLKTVDASSTKMKTIIAASGTVTDAARQIIGDALALGGLPRHVGGLRAGNATVLDSSGAFKLNKYQYVKGVVVSGTVDAGLNAKLTIHGGGALSGSLKLGANGSVSGRLGGKKVTIGAMASLRSSLPTPQQVMASLTPPLATR